MFLSFSDNSVCDVGTAFLTSSKVAIYEGLHWGMSKVSKQGDV